METSITEVKWKNELAHIYYADEIIYLIVHFSIKLTGKGSGDWHN
jgi:hypothetical protein